ncbi:acyl carrier protein phosphodiesterase [Alteromonas sp. ASW11-130]|uniref:acyl carrier protein phosphodiesterase n=1 Tax=Alteromonas sp. ASW11-130 TaxID=3015775 RepID=UPI0022429AD7|nr:ACP phosphodiesterase [Alteromonas sp. ASW11-130]MCW8092530.1 ACP phosphodiesterase [Alteromonas sp. ASW11-130]
MNYLAHLYFAQRNADSHFGNLLGDFGGTKFVEEVPTAVRNGLENHYLVDKFTDNHSAIKEAKRLFAAQRRRFAGIAIDVVFDHFLIQHWDSFHTEPLAKFKHHSFALLRERIPCMPPRMQHVISHLTTNDWFKEYESIAGVGLALDNIAKRIRFSNNFEGSVEDISRHYQELEAIFLAFFPQLSQHVRNHALERNNKCIKNK